MEALLAKHGLEQDASIRRYTDYKEMVETEKPTLVGIATESGIHAEIALYCIAHSVNVIIEKPMAMSMADADASWKPRSEPCQGVRLPSKPLQPGGAGYPEGTGGGPLRQALPRSIHVRWNRNKAITTRLPGAAPGPRTAGA